MEKFSRSCNVQIFGTDIDEQAVNFARTGLYPKSISADVNEDRLKKYFRKEDDRYQINKSIREMVVFAPQNVIKDPPFTRLDMLSCRNLLIYFTSELQNKLLPRFHYSLKQDGVLFLGSSETIGPATDLFTVWNKKWKVFKRNSAEKGNRPVLVFPVSATEEGVVKNEPPAPVSKIREVNILQLLKTILLQSDIPASIIIDDKADIIYIHGRTGRFLELAEGETSINILDLARPGLKAGLENALQGVAVDRQETTIKNLQIRYRGGYINVNLTVRPIPDFQTGSHGLKMVMFEELKAALGGPEGESSDGQQNKKSDEVRKLEKDLFYTRENLQTTIEELEASNEELKSTNEELQSTNEKFARFHRDCHLVPGLRPVCPSLHAKDKQHHPAGKY